MSRALRIAAALMLIAACALAAFAVSTAEQIREHSACEVGCRYDSTITLPDSSHNERGGYIDACGDLPGLVGDDC
jgi:hypothetical protein